MLARDQPRQRQEQKTATATVTIKVTDENDNKPVFLLHARAALGRLRVSYRAPVGFRVARIFAADSDSGDNGRVKFSLQQFDGELCKNFNINTFTGELVVSQKMNRSQVGGW